MAVRHGLAGQYGKSEALLRSRRVMLLIMSFLAYGCLLVGLGFGYLWGRYSIVLGSVVMAGIAIVIYATWLRVVAPYVDRVAKERLKFLRGGQAEGLVAWLLEDLDNNWHIFNNIKLDGDGDIDHVVVGPGGLFCVSTKSHRGVFSGTREGLLHNGEPSPFASQAMRQTMDLRKFLQRGLQFEVPWVQAILAVPYGFTERDACDGKVWLVHQDDLVDRIDPEKASKRLSKEQIARINQLLGVVPTTSASPSA